jgi:hypothetical protein
VANCDCDSEASFAAFHAAVRDNNVGGGCEKWEFRFVYGRVSQEIRFPFRWLSKWMMMVSNAWGCSSSSGVAGFALGKQHDVLCTPGVDRVSWVADGSSWGCKGCLDGSSVLALDRQLAAVGSVALMDGVAD